MILYVLTVIGIGAWISFRERGVSGHLFLAPPITAVLLVGVLWRRASAAGAVAVLTLYAVFG